MSLSPCCLKIGSFAKGTPAGKIEEFNGKDTYITGDKNSKAAILLVADVFGISLVNTQILADKLAKGVGATVYIPDYFDGEDLVKQGMLEGKKVDVPALIGKVSRCKCEPDDARTSHLTDSLFSYHSVRSSRASLEEDFRRRSRNPQASTRSQNRRRRLLLGCDFSSSFRF